MREYRQYIAGQWTGADRLFDDLDPYRGTVMARIPAGTRADAARAVDAAAAAFPGWAAMPPAERQALFLRTADIVDRRADEIKALLAEETGCASGFAGFQVLTSTRLLRQAANWGYLPAGEVIRSDTPDTFALALRRPLGVVAGISPWNGAHVLAWRTVVNPLAFGNTVVLKPSEEAPVSAGLMIAEIMAEAGFPPGVINVITHAPGEAVPIADEFFGAARGPVHQLHRILRDRPHPRRAGRARPQTLRPRTRRVQPADRARRRRPGLCGRVGRVRRVLPLRAGLHERPEGPHRAAGLRRVHRPAHRPGPGAARLATRPMPSSSGR